MRCGFLTDPLTRRLDHFARHQQKKTVAIWPRDGSRSGDAPLVSPETGMIGYPEFQQAAVSVRTLFNPEIVIGKPIEVKSQLPAANGRWSVFGAAHHLAAQLPDGPWETTATGSRAAV
jgi:hypothetical protein